MQDHTTQPVELGHAATVGTNDTVIYYALLTLEHLVIYIVFCGPYKIINLESSLLYLFKQSIKSPRPNDFSWPDVPKPWEQLSTVPAAM